MAFNVSALLDKAKVVHRLPSDYKLALVMGVKQTTLANYRQGKTLPDARVIRLICELTGDDPALLAAEIEAERATTEDARALWREVVQRLQSTLHAAIFSVVAAGVLLGALPSDAHAKTAHAGPFSSIYIVECLRVIVHRWCMAARRYIAAALFRSPCHA